MRTCMVKRVRATGRGIRLPLTSNVIGGAEKPETTLIFRDNDLPPEARGQLPSRHNAADSQAYPHRSTWLAGAWLKSAGWTRPYHDKPLQRPSRISMPRSALARELSQAEEQVAKDPDRIAHQRAVVSRHEEGGLDCAIARAILDQLETLQRAHIADRDRLLAEGAF
jgi:hypothetical protein